MKENLFVILDFLPSDQVGKMSERSETESERDLDGIDVVSEPDASSKRSSLRSGTGGVIDRNDSSPAPHQVSRQKWHHVLRKMKGNQACHSLRVLLSI
jgi:hypothetical protein